MSNYGYNKGYAKAYLEKFERIDLKVPKGQRQLIKDHAAAQGESVNAFIIRAIETTMQRDNKS